MSTKKSPYEEGYEKGQKWHHDAAKNPWRVGFDPTYPNPPHRSGDLGFNRGVTEGMKDDKTLPSDACLLATACLEAKALPNNCPQLSAMRAFRDEYVRNLPDGEQIISEYYTIAPQIIEGIEQSENPKEVYAVLYEKLNTTLELIQSEKMTLDEFLREGLKTLDDLKKRYL